MLTLSLAELMTAALLTVTGTLLVVAMNTRRERLRRHLAAVSIVAGAAASFALYSCYTGEADIWFDPVTRGASNGPGKMLVLARSGSSGGNGAAVGRGSGRSSAGTGSDSVGSSGRSDGDLPEEVEGAPLSRNGFWLAAFGPKNIKPKTKPKLAPFRDCPDCPEMVPLEPGYGVLGADDKDTEALPFERPQRVVRIGKPFAIGRTEITVAEFNAYLKATKRARSCGRPLSGELAHPIDCISFGEARAYAEWLSDRTGQTYRLPSAGEWEYAARAGTATPYVGGWNLAAQTANVGAQPAAVKPVGSYPANGYGLHDMSGNVAEWTQDCWLPNMAAAPSDGGWATAGADCSRRVVKDGAWADQSRFARVSSRRPLAPAMALPGVGFRVVREMNAIR